MKKLPIDGQRVYLTGLSMGGFGSWELGMRRPELFAAVAPVCVVEGEPVEVATGFFQIDEKLRRHGYDRQRPVRRRGRGAARAGQDGHHDHRRPSAR